MRAIHLLAGLLLLLGGVSSASAQAGYYGYPDDRRGWGPRDAPQARIWVDDDRDYLRRGDRMRIRFATDDDAYIAILHVDTEGNLDFVYPATPWDSERVRGGREYSLPRGFQASGLTVRGRPGIGYLYVIASPVPLDYRHFSRGRAGWDWSYAGRAVRGDPFWAFEQITRLLLPEWPYAPYGADYYSYYVEGRNHRYPSYACSDRYYGYNTGYAWGWHAGYGPCDRLDLFLDRNPYYYDARRYRGDRYRYYREYRDYIDPRHSYKEGVGRSPARGWDGDRRDEAPRSRGTTGGGAEREPRVVRPDRREPAEEGNSSSGRRPTLERRRGEQGEDRPSSRPATASPERARSGGSGSGNSGGARESSGSRGRTEPATKAAPRTARPRGGGSEEAGKQPQP